MATLSLPTSSSRLGVDRNFPPPAAAAFIFDVDGVLARSDELHLAAWRRLAVEHGLPLEDPEALRGRSREESLRLILGGRPVTPAQSAELTARKNGYYLECLESRCAKDLVRPGVLALLDHLAALGVGRAAASSSRNARRVLERAELSHRFEVVVDGGDVARPKPAPDLFLRAAAALRIAAEKCVVVEDAPSGVAAARAARMRCIGVGHARALGAADLIVAALDDRPPEELVRRFLPSPRASVAPPAPPRPQ